MPHVAELVSLARRNGTWAVAFSLLFSACQSSFQKATVPLPSNEFHLFVGLSLTDLLAFTPETRLPFHAFNLWVCMNEAGTLPVSFKTRMYSSLARLTASCKASSSADSRKRRGTGKFCDTVFIDRTTPADFPFTI